MRPWHALARSPGTVSSTCLDTRHLVQWFLHVAFAGGTTKPQASHGKPVLMLIKFFRSCTVYCPRNRKMPMSRPRLISREITRWCFAHAPVFRRGRILFCPLMNLRSSSVSCIGISCSFSAHITHSVGYFRCCFGFIVI